MDTTPSSSPLETLLIQLSSAPDPPTTARLAEEAIGLVQRDQNPVLWASLHGAMAAGLAGACRGRYTEELFTKVRTAYEAALTVYTPDATPAIWGQTWRNIGATYMGAAQSGIGDPRQMIEAAIAAYQQSIRIPFDQQEASLWLSAQRELGRALGIAAAWRGPRAHVDSALAYSAALTHVDREAQPEMWAVLKLLCGSALNESGVVDVSEDAIRACEDALEILRVETHAADWAEAQLILGGLYRTRRAGRRDENLERATASLDRALQVYTREHAPQQWLRAHYHRGPAYVFRIHGDRRENLERAIESLQIAIDATPADREPAAWASLVVTLGQAFMDRVEGDRQENLEIAIRVLESGLGVLSPSPALSWTLGHRLLGLAYLERQGGDRQDNVERAIAALTTGAASLQPSENPQAWAEIQANLGEAYRRRTAGDPRENRAHERTAYEAALSVARDHWPNAAGWLDLQRRLVIVSMFEASDQARAEDPPEDARATPADEALWPDSGPPPPRDPSDPFDMARQAHEQAEALRDAFASGVQATLDVDWHVPFMLNEEASLLGHQFQQFLRSEDAPARSADEQSMLEIRRWKLVQLLLEHLAEKHHAARRTEALFRDVERGTRGFVLYLRGFAYRRHAYPGATVVHGGGPLLGEIVEKQRLAKKLEPVALVSIANPVDSAPLEQASASAASIDGGDVGFRVESGASWQSDVRGLIAASDFIVIHNPVMMPGLIAEINMVQELGRLDDTFFVAPALADEALGVTGRCRALDDDAIAHMRASIHGRTIDAGVLPPATCAWVGGAYRQRLEHMVNGLDRWLAGLAPHRSADTIDIELDASASLIGTLVLLEDLDRLPRALLARSEMLRWLGAEPLKDAAPLIDRYTAMAAQITQAARNRQTVPTV